MKVILTHDVPKVGKKYDVKDVADGFARNVLFVKKTAVLATKENLIRFEREKNALVGERTIRKELLLKNLEDLGESRISIFEGANEKGHLFAGVHKEEIVRFVKEQTGLDITADALLLPHAIKEVGDHEIPVEIDGKKTSFTLHIEKKLT